MRPELRPGVQAEHGQHDAGQRGRDVHRALAVAVRDHLVARTGARDQLQGHAERARQLAQGARHLDPAGGRIDGGDRQAQARERLADQVHVGGVSPVPLGQFVAGQDGGPLDDLGRNIGPAAQHQRHFGPLGGVQLASRPGFGQRRTLAAW
jgi:hypothetical protein